MKLPLNLLLPALLGTATAASNLANVYIFPTSKLDGSTDTPTLSREEARLVIAQRLGVSQYHSLHDATNDGIRYIDIFGARQASVFGNSPEDDERSHLVLMVEGVTAGVELSMSSQWEEMKPAFKISSPPSKTANLKLIEDIMAQSSSGAVRQSCSLEDAINPFQEKCWSGKNNFIYVDVQSSKDATDRLHKATQRLLRYADDDTMDIMIIMMPELSRTTDKLLKPYGSYDMPSHARYARNQPEELIDLESTAKPQSSRLEAQASNNVASSTSPAGPLKTIIPRCHGSADSCIAATGNCSGHGSCRKKYGVDNQNACYSCFCLASVNMTDGYKQSIHWGGSACQKEDISAQFWLLAGFSVAAVGLVSWGIGMLFSIGEEKLPGVIGAGVSGPKAR